MLLFLAALPAYGELPPINVQLDPVWMIPYGNPSGVVKGGQDLDLYAPGYGLDLSGALSYFGYLAPFVSLDLNSVPLNGVSGSALTSEQLGAGLSVFTYPIPRMITTLGLGGGISFTSLSSSAATSVGGVSPFWKMNSEVGYRFTPGFSVSGLVGYTEILGSQVPILKSFALGLRFNLGLDQFLGGNSGLGVDILHQDKILPIVYYKSDTNPIATIRIFNADAAEVRDVKVSFSAGSYTSRPAACGEYPMILHNGSVDVPIYAAFNDKVLGFTENTKIQGEVKIDYKILDDKRSTTKVVTVDFSNRNAATWVNPKVVGAFVSPQDPAMLEFSKYVAGLIRVRAIPEIDKSLQFGMGIFEGLRVYGLVWSADPSAPYASVRKDLARQAYIQYPAQTLSYKSGDSDALALTVAEALESIAVPTAIAALPQDVIVAFALEMNEAQARATFSHPELFIFDSGTVWVPLRASLIRDGFLRAWQGGADLWRAQPASAVSPLIRVDASWKEYSPVALAGVDFKPVKPTEEEISQAFGTTLERFAQAEAAPKIDKILAGVTDEPTGSQWNSLGIVYAQFGFYEKAKDNFEKAVAKEYGPAVINLANIAFLQKDFITAAEGFEKALSASPNNKNVLLGLARARYELGDYDGTNELFLRVRAIDPVLAERFSYLSLKVKEDANATTTPVRSGG